MTTGLTDPFALVAIRGKFVGRVIRVAPEEGKVRWTVGRSDDADISLAGDDALSPQHLIISPPHPRLTPPTPSATTPLPLPYPPPPYSSPTTPLPVP